MVSYFAQFIRRRNYVYYISGRKSKGSECIREGFAICLDQPINPLYAYFFAVVKAYVSYLTLFCFAFLPGV